MSHAIEYHTMLERVDWDALKTALAADRFDNGRSARQLRRSFENSTAVVLAWADETVVGTARALSDGVCNAYVVDVWTDSRHRRHGIAREMMRRLLAGLTGQHVGLFSSDATEFYRAIGFDGESGGMSRVVGRWLADVE